MTGNYWRLAETSISLVQTRTVVRENNSVSSLKELPYGVVSYIASFVHPKGATIGNNACKFFYARSTSISPLATLQIDISKVDEALGIHDVESTIQAVIRSYLFNSTLSPREKETATKSLISALQNIDKEEAQALVRGELATLSADNVTVKLCN